MSPVRPSETSSSSPLESTLPSLWFFIKTNFIKRVIVGAILITGFVLLILAGPLIILLTALLVQLFCFNEVITIGYNYNKIPNLLYFRSLCWYFVILANYFLCGEIIAPHFQFYIEKFPIIKFLIDYHRFISFLFYLGGLLWFLLSLVKKHDYKQFRLLGWTHTLLILFVLQSYMIIRNIFQGLIWLILPVSLVTLNDIWAYVFGRLFGRTPLIKLSPNKTWEGFIGGCIGTIISGFLLTNFMCKFQYLICPFEYIVTTNGLQLKTDCNVNYLFIPNTYTILSLSIDFYPFNWHFLALALFSSLIAPFGGFCASGFKRATKVKDFSTLIPGHGGIMDRFDCQFLTATFVNVYISTFVYNNSVEFIFRKIMYLNNSDQVQFYYMLKDNLETAGFL